MNIKMAVSIMPILQTAKPSTLTALISFAMLKRFKKGEHLFLERDDVQYIYFLAEGIASLYKIGNTQEKKVIFIYSAGALINETILDGTPSSINCELLSDAQILCFERQNFLCICEQDFKLARAVMDSMSLKIRRMYHQIKNTVNTVRGDKRISAKLWKLSKDHGVPCKEGIMINFDLTITFLADMLGSKRETVSRQIKVLTNKGLVIIERNKFIIPDREKLRKYFDEM